VSIDLATNELHYQRHDAEPWRVHDRWAPAPGT
jgi:glucose-1-phosphate cytidylyltransferase